MGGEKKSFMERRELNKQLRAEQCRGCADKGRSNLSSTGRRACKNTAKPAREEEVGQSTEPSSLRRSFAVHGITLWLLRMCRLFQKLP